MTSNLAWIISANMGLGHQRATYPLRNLACERILLFGEDDAASVKEKKLWKLFQGSYEFISRTKDVPFVGPAMFSLLERLQNISPYYPFRDQSRPSFQVKSLSRMIQKGMGQGLGKKISSRKLPVVTSFYAAAIAAEEQTDLPVYCIICDTDINRVWVSKNPKKSRIMYFVPCGRAMKRLMQYGVPEKHIYVTGFPLPHENIGGLSMPILRNDLAKRLERLDPSRRFHVIHGEECRHYLGNIDTTGETDKPVTVTFAIGGAGAQTEIAQRAIQSLASPVKEGKVRLNLVAGVRQEVEQFFVKNLEKLGMLTCGSVKIIYHQDKIEYFRAFNEILHTTDVLWTKPSELSFYCGLGIPIIIAPPIGPHEAANRQWLQEIGAGLPQQDPRYFHEWLMDYLNDGRLAQSAWDGFLYARKMGTYKIEEILTTGTMSKEASPHLLSGALL